MSECYLDTENKFLCCGCKVCSAVCSTNAIKFRYDDEGFWYPKIDEEKCVQCGRCKTVCPLNTDDLPIIKDYSQNYAAYAKSIEILKKSASGGMFSVLSDVVLNDAGVVFGHIYNENCQVICTKANSKLIRDSMCGSKYVQSDMGNIYKDIKTACIEKKTVLFTGTPCQVDAVKNFFGKTIPDNLYTVGLVCHGVPSPKIFDEYLDIQEKKAGKKISEVIFRDKENGWSMPMRKFRYSDGSFSIKVLNDDAFNNLFLGMDCILRPSCYACKYAGKERVEDITIADFWGIQNKYEDMYNNNNGVSAVLVNSEKGKKLFNIACSELVYKKVPLIDVQNKNGPLRRPTKQFKYRDKVFSEYKKYGAEYILTKYINRKKILSFLPIRIMRKMIRICKKILIKGEKN